MNNLDSNGFSDTNNNFQKNNYSENIPNNNGRNLIEIYKLISKGFVAFFAVMFFSQFILSYISVSMSRDVVSEGWFNLFLTDVPIYVIAIWTFLFFAFRIDPVKIEKRKFGINKIVMAFLIIFFFMFFGAFIGNYADSFMQRVFNSETKDSLTTTADSMPLSLQIVFFSIIAPLGEEFIFRKLLLDRTAQYGEGLAIVFSALTFSLFHANISQFFYAFGAGIVLAYVYVKSGKWSLCVALHSAINLCLGVLIPYLSKYVFTEKKHIIAIFSVELMISVAGLIILVLLISFKKLSIKKSEYVLEENIYPKALFNFEMIVYTFFSVMVSMLSYV